MLIQNNIKVLLLKYSYIQIHTQKINTCFQVTFALYIKPILMFACIVPATLLINPKLRATTSSAGLLLCLYVCINAYIMLAIGYYIPGKVNSISRQNLELFKSMLEKADGVYSRLECSYKMKSCRDIRIYIGSTNFYERTTALNILEFVIDQTINITLLF